MNNQRVCAVCGRVLDYVSGAGWRHTLTDLENEDHPAVPVALTDIAPVFRCDFCSVDDPAWSIPVESFEVSPGHGSDADWAACDVCVQFVRRRSWRQLADRASSASGLRDRYVKTWR